MVWHVQLNRAAKDNVAKAVQWLESNRIDYDVELRGKHPAFVLKHQTMSRRVTFSGSPSAYAGDTILRRVKGEMEALGWQPAPPKSLLDLAKLSAPPQPINQLQEEQVMGRFSHLSKDAREFAENIETFAAKRGVTVSVENGGSHPRFVFERGARTRHFVFASTPSDHRTRLNESSRIRRLFDEEGWDEIKEREVVARDNSDRGGSFYRPSTGAASPVTRPLHLITATPDPEPAPPSVMTPPPLSSPDAIHLLGWEVPHIPDDAKQNQSSRGGRKGAEYNEFVNRRTHWCETVRRAGASWTDIIETLAKAGHVTTPGALMQALTKTRVRETVTTVLKRNASTQKPINDLVEKMNDIVRQIVERSTENLVSEMEALQQRLDRAQRERAEYKDKYDTIKGVLKDF